MFRMKNVNLNFDKNMACISTEAKTNWCYHVLDRMQRPKEANKITSIFEI